MSALPPRPAPRARRVSRVGLTAALALVCATLLARGGPAVAFARPAEMGVEIYAAGCALVPRHGSGVALGDHLVATAAHVVAGATDVTVVEHDGTKHAAEIAALDTRRDAAVLRARTLERAPIRFGVLVAGEPASYLGFAGAHPNTVIPLVVERAITIGSEDIYIKDNYTRPGYQVHGDVIAGDSGAGVLSARGSLAALIWAADRVAEREAFAVSASVVTDLLPAVGPSPAPAVPCP